MGPTEAREAFFATTRLFQSKDVTLRRMVHLVIKELPTAPDDAIIATSRLLLTFVKDNFKKAKGFSPDLVYLVTLYELPQSD